MKRLIISWDSYSWVIYCAGRIARDPKRYEIIVVSKDDTIPIHRCKNLCSSAIYEQRAEDLYNIGTRLKIKKLTNLLVENYESESEISRIIAQLQLYIIIGGIREVYFQHNEILQRIIPKICTKANIPAFSYSSSLDSLRKEVIMLDKDELESKKELINLMVGSPTEPICPNWESLYIIQNLKY